MGLSKGGVVVATIVPLAEPAKRARIDGHINVAPLQNMAVLEGLAEHEKAKRRLQEAKAKCEANASKNAEILAKTVNSPHANARKRDAIVAEKEHSRMDHIRKLSDDALGTTPLLSIGLNEARDRIDKLKADLNQDINVGRSRKLYTLEEDYYLIKLNKFYNGVTSLVGRLSKDYVTDYHKASDVGRRDHLYKYLRKRMGYQHALNLVRNDKAKDFDNVDPQVFRFLLHCAVSLDRPLYRDDPRSVPKCSDTGVDVDDDDPHEPIESSTPQPQDQDQPLPLPQDQARVETQVQVQTVVAAQPTTTPARLASVHSKSLKKTAVDAAKQAQSQPAPPTPAGRSALVHGKSPKRPIVDEQRPPADFNHVSPQNPVIKKARVAPETDQVVVMVDSQSLPPSQRLTRSRSQPKK